MKVHGFVRCMIETVISDKIVKFGYYREFKTEVQNMLPQSVFLYFSYN